MQKQEPSHVGNFRITIDRPHDSLQKLGESTYSEGVEGAHVENTTSTNTRRILVHLQTGAILNKDDIPSKVLEALKLVGRNRLIVAEVPPNSNSYWLTAKTREKSRRALARRNTIMENGIGAIDELS